MRIIQPFRFYELRHVATAQKGFVIKDRVIALSREAKTLLK